MFHWLKNFMKLRNKNCIACLLWPLLFFDSSTVVTYRCTHNANETNKKFRVSKTRLFISTLMVSGQFFRMWITAARFQSLPSTEEKIIGAGEMFFMVGLMCLFVFNLTLNKRKTRMVETYQKLLDASRYFKIKNVFSSTDAKKIRKRIAQSLIVNVTTNVMFLILWTRNETCKKFSYCLVDVMLIISSFSLMLNLFQSLNAILLYKTFHAKFDNKIKRAILKNTTYDTYIVSLPNLEMNLEDELKMVRSFYHNLTKLIVKINRFYGVETLVWYIFIIVMITFNAYMITLKLYRGDALTNNDVEFFARMVSCAGVTISYTFKMQSIEDIGNEMLSFLLQHPIGTLTQSEALQVEALINTLQIEPPSINIMDIFTAGAKLLASIGGTVITYVLVALQFYSSE